MIVNFKKILKTEKTLKLSTNGSVCCFTVNKEASKNNIKKAFENLFSVKVEKINILNQKPKFFTFKNQKSKSSLIKKVYLKLKPGFSIPSSFAINNQNVEK